MRSQRLSSRPNVYSICYQYLGYRAFKPCDRKKNKKKKVLPKSSIDNAKLYIYTVFIYSVCVFARFIIGYQWGLSCAWVRNKAPDKRSPL